MKYYEAIEKFKTYNIVLLCGLYGAGKTEFANMYFKNSGLYRISRLELRKLMYEMTHFGEPWAAEKFNEEDDVLAKHVERKITEHFIQNKRNVLIINTFMTKKSRQRFISIAKENKKTIGAIFLDTPLEKCIEQSKRLSLNIPEYVIRQLHSKKELPTKLEGFNDVLIIHDFTLSQ